MVSGTRASPPTPALAWAVPGQRADFLYLFSLHSWCHQLLGPPGPAWGLAPASSGVSLLSPPDSCSRTPCPAGPAAKTQPESSREGGGGLWRGGDPPLEPEDGALPELVRTSDPASPSLMLWVETMRPGVWKKTCPDLTARGGQCVLLAPISSQPSVPANKVPGHLETLR